MTGRLSTLIHNWLSNRLPPALPSHINYTSPSEETEYFINPEIFHRDRTSFREKATEITRTLLKVHPRQVTEVAIEAEPFVMPNSEPNAYQQLVEAGMTVSVEDKFWGKTAETHPLTPLPATSANVKNSLTLLPYTNKVIFIDKNCQYLVNYYDSGGTYQFWLPDEYRPILQDQLTEDTYSGILTIDEYLSEEHLSDIIYTSNKCAIP